MQFAVSEWPVACQIVLGQLAVLDGLERVADAGLCHCVLEQHNIRFLVFRVEDGKGAHMSGPSASGDEFYSPAALSSTQKRLPRPGSDSNPTLPPIFSTALRTTVRPTPVPS